MRDADINDENVDRIDGEDDCSYSDGRLYSEDQSYLIHDSTVDTWLSDDAGSGSAGQGSSSSGEAAKLWRQNVMLRLMLLQANLRGFENEVHKMGQSHTRGLTDHSPLGEHHGEE